MEFNHSSRKKNIAISSVINTICRVAYLLIGFVYRMWFLKILSVEYLGINGVFTNIIGLMSFADLGISAAIIYRIYEPLSREDTERVGQLMRFFKKAYHLVALVLLVFGCVIAFFLPAFIRDRAEIPGDVNIYLTFFLFLLQSVSSYFFTYRLTMFDVDQKQFINTLINTVTMAVRCLVQILLLVSFRSYQLSLLAGILVTVFSNFLTNLWVTREYPHVFSVKSDLSRAEERAIYKDTLAAICHKIGGIVIASTDNLLLAKYLGLAITGIFSNYSMILSGFSTMIAVLFGPFTAALGNVHATEDCTGRYRAYKRSLYVNFWIVGMITACMYLLINDFITLWLGAGMLLDEMTVFFLCIQFYLTGSRKVPEAYISVCGLFVRDKGRPIIEAVLNLTLSIFLLKRIGVAGVFAGTVFSCLLTTYWREQYLLYKYVFQVSSLDFWIFNLRMVFVTGITIIVGKLSTLWIFGGERSILQWILKGIWTVILFGVVNGIIFWRNEEFRYATAALRKTLRAGIGSH
ncbi:Membrane protein involved in the export of O-antigen and teichoic acid [[Clostridium] aminophilum]|uniref:Membrane protein involved in the export of O-antigen and teichoic acid n=1 Tax=[Clostridium] aminophilum TaxID=1526 RepID=A0A1I0C9E4_9FIRM|nr:hypothetical protein [[Clostridium] aminophilum]SET16185.1 Membrane protein involved in the export of O-antigen and teichoic acid [[Clostridium] aminophilum]